mmetsp:Transcript_21617/g.47483  ORF Transcript_21617/g.47483 Transcript_21617/m.47483 type:complete len:205 (-) Transcript_21617:75-689(-)
MIPPGVVCVRQSSMLAPCMCRNDVTVPIKPGPSSHFTVRIPVRCVCFVASEFDLRGPLASDFRVDGSPKSNLNSSFDPSFEAVFWPCWTDSINDGEGEGDGNGDGDGYITLSSPVTLNPPSPLSPGFFLPYPLSLPRILSGFDFIFPALLVGVNRTPLTPPRAEDDSLRVTGAPFRNGHRAAKIAPPPLCPRRRGRLGKTCANA